MNLKTIAFILALQFATGLVVFSLTRSYYLSTPPASQVAAVAPVAQGSFGPSTQRLINSLQRQPQKTTPDDPGAFDEQANRAFQAGDYAKAEPLYRRVVELAPKLAEPRNNLGLTLHYLGRSQEALEVLKQGTEVEPTYQRIWLTLGFVNRSLGKTAEAKKAFERAIELGPDTPPGKSASKMLNQLP